MGKNEWPLIGFTLLVQCAVGLVVGLTAVYSPLAGRVGSVSAGDTALVVLVIALGLLALGGGAATLHLGNIRNVYLVLANWRSSWLSREVAMVAVFTVTVGAYAIVYLSGAAATVWRVAAGIASSMVGLALIATIAKLYMLRTVPVWNRSATPLTFYATSMLLGFVGIAAVVAQADGTDRIVRGLSGAALAVLVCQLAVFADHRSHLRRQDGAARVSGRILDVTRARETTLRVGLAIIGGLVLALTGLGWMPAAGGVIIAGLFVLAAELLGRWLFYESYARSGL